MEPNRLYRSRTDRKIAGVAGGLAEYFMIDPLFIRLAFIVLVFAGFGGVMVYIILWIVAPENPLQLQYVTAKPDQDFNRPANEPFSYSYEAQPAEDISSQAEVPPSAASAPPAPQTKEKQKGNLVFGVILISVGTFILIWEIIPQINIGYLWPVILIVAGVALLAKAFTGRKRNINQF